MKKLLSEGFTLVMIGVALVFVPIRGHLSSGRVAKEVALAHIQRANSSDYDVPDWLDATEEAMGQMPGNVRGIGERK